MLHLAEIAPGIGERAEEVGLPSGLHLGHLFLASLPFPAAIAPVSSASQPLFALAWPQLTWAKMFRKMFKEVGSGSSRMSYDMDAYPFSFCFTIFLMQSVLA